VTAPKYPDVKVQLAVRDGNPFMIIARVRTALKQKHPYAVEPFTTEASSGDYNHVIQTCMEWVTVT